MLRSLVGSEMCIRDRSYNPEKDTLTCRAKHCPQCGMPVDEKGVCTDAECGKTTSAPVGLEYRVEEDIPIMLILSLIHI